MDILISSDHAGFELKKKLYSYLKEQGHNIVDYGPHEFDPDDDYPDFIAPLAQEISQNSMSRGIIIGASGQGEAMTANRFTGVRAMVYIGEPVPKDGRKLPNPIILSREHNDSNVLSLGAKFLSDDDAIQAVALWLKSDFSREERHMRRIRKMDSFHDDSQNLPADSELYRML